MLLKRCAGGVVFCHDRVLLLYNEKHEWVLPKGVLNKELGLEGTALESVKRLTGLDTRVFCESEETDYERYSITKHRPLHINVKWFVLLPLEDCDGTDCLPEIHLTDHDEKGGFFPMEEALQKVTYTQERVLLVHAYQKLMHD